mgnify:FL=1
MNQQGSNADADFAIRRALTGLCSIGLLIGWGAVLYFGDQDKADTIAPVLMRLGLVTGALWLALPEVRAIFKNVSGKGVLLFGVALVAAATSKASVVPLTLLGGGLLVVLGARRAWQWLWEPLPTAAPKNTAASSKVPAVAKPKKKSSSGK